MGGSRARMREHLAEITGDEGLTPLPQFVTRWRAEHLQAEIDLRAEQDSLVRHLPPGALDAPERLNKRSDVIIQGVDLRVGVRTVPGIPRPWVVERAEHLAKLLFGDSLAEEQIREIADILFENGSLFLLCLIVIERAEVVVWSLQEADDSEVPAVLIIAISVRQVLEVDTIPCGEILGHYHDGVWLPKK